MPAISVDRRVIAGDRPMKELRERFSKLEPGVIFFFEEFFIKTDLPALVTSSSRGLCGVFSATSAAEGRHMLRVTSHEAVDAR